MTSHDPADSRDPFDRIADALEALVQLQRLKYGLPLVNTASEPTDILGLDATEHPDALGISLIDDALSADYELDRQKSQRAHPFG